MLEEHRKSQDDLKSFVHNPKRKSRLRVKGLPQTEDFDDQWGIDDYVRRDGMVSDGMDPGVAGAQSDDRFHHSRTEILQDDKYQRQCDIPRRVECRPAFDDVHGRVGDAAQKNRDGTGAGQLELAWNKNRIDQHHGRKNGAYREHAERKRRSNQKLASAQLKDSRKRAEFNQTVESHPMSMEELRAVALKEFSLHRKTHDLGVAAQIADTVASHVCGAHRRVW